MAALCNHAGVHYGANPAPSYPQRTKPRVCRRRALHPSSGSPRSRNWQMTFLTMSKKFTQAVREEDIARGPGKRACTHHPNSVDTPITRNTKPTVLTGGRANAPAPQAMPQARPDIPKPLLQGGVEGGGGKICVWGLLKAYA